MKLTRKKMQRKRAQRGGGLDKEGGGLNEDEKEEILYRISELGEGKIKTLNIETGKPEDNLEVIRVLVAANHLTDLGALNYVISELKTLNINNTKLKNYIESLTTRIDNLSNACPPRPVVGHYPPSYCWWEKGEQLVDNGIPGQKEFPYYCGEEGKWLSDIHRRCAATAAGGRRRHSRKTAGRKTAGRKTAGRKTAGRKTTGRSRKTTGRSRKTTGRSRKTTGRKTRSDKKH